MNRTWSAALLLVCVVLLCGCEKRAGSTAPAARGKLAIVATLFPLYDIARTVGGERVDVTLLLPPGVEPHSFQPRPDDLVRMRASDIFLYTNRYMEPWALALAGNLAAEKLLLVDASTGVTFLKGEGVGHGAGADAPAGDEHRHHSHENGAGMDPHIWLDFGNAAIMVDNIAAALSQRDPAGKEYYRARAVEYRARLDRLDRDYRAALSHCDATTLLHGGHYTFGYLAARYGLRYRSAAAVNADAEPTPATLVELVRLVRTLGLRHVYSEELLSPRVAEMIAREAGVTVLMLHGAHNVSREEFSAGITFPALMEKNLASLKTGLGCR